MAGFGATHTTAHPAQAAVPKGSHVGATPKNMATVPGSRMAQTSGIVPMSSAQIAYISQNVPIPERVQGVKGALFLPSGQRLFLSGVVKPGITKNWGES